MGSRADAVIVQDGKVRIHFDKWAAEHMDALLFWGLKHALEEFREWDISEEYGPDWNGNGLMDDILAEGAAASTSTATTSSCTAMVAKTRSGSRRI